MILKEITYIVMMYGETFYGRHTAQHQLLRAIKSQKGLPLETKNT